MIPKFRAWDKFDKVMRDVTLLDYNQNFVGYSYPVFMKSTMHMELMRSTGLRDMNNREIFEGDVVQFEDCSEMSDSLYVNTGIIEWCQGGFHITNRDSVSMEDLLDGDVLEVKIIGNIFENKELLEEKE